MYIKRTLKQSCLKNMSTLLITQRNKRTILNNHNFICFNNVFVFIFSHLSKLKMNNSFSLQQISTTSNLDANLISPQHKLYVMADFMRIKYENPKLRQSEIALRMNCSTSTLQRYRNDINMLSPFRIQPNSTNKQQKMTSNLNSNNDIHSDLDFKRPQMISNDPKRPQSTQAKMLNRLKTKRKSIVKAGFVRGNVEINEHY